MENLLSKLKEYWWLIGIIGMVSLPYLQEKLGISTIKTEQSQLIEKNLQLVEELRQAECNSISLFKSVIRLQNEVFNSNELIFSKLETESLDVTLARTRVGDAKVDLLEDLEKLSKKNNCLF